MSWKYLLLLFCSGCTSSQYLFQACRGQWALLNRAVPLESVLSGPLAEKTPSYILDLLRQVSKIKDFGVNHRLKATSHYQKYVSLNRPVAVWVVSACQPLKFESKLWKFPIVGSFPYLGWFDQKDAEVFAENLKKEGWDVDLRGAAAYSTAGWFQDPILSTMLSGRKGALGDLVEIILHESVHATFMIQDQSYFNESLAQFIGKKLAAEYLESQGLALEKKEYLKSQEQRNQDHEKFHQVYLILSRLYQDEKKSDTLKKHIKSLWLRNLQRVLKTKKAITNASLIQYRLYDSGSEAFEDLWSSCQHWDAFWNLIQKIDGTFFRVPHQSDIQSVVAKLHG